MFDPKQLQEVAEGSTCYESSVAKTLAKNPENGVHSSRFTVQRLEMHWQKSSFVFFLNREPLNLEP